MSDLEMPISVVSRLVKEGQSADNNVIIGKDVKKAYAQIAGLFPLYVFST